MPTVGGLGKARYATCTPQAVWLPACSSGSMRQRAGDHVA